MALPAGLPFPSAAPPPPRGGDGTSHPPRLPPLLPWLRRHLGTSGCRKQPNPGFGGPNRDPSPGPFPPPRSGAGLRPVPVRPGQEGRAGRYHPSRQLEGRPDSPTARGRGAERAGRLPGGGAGGRGVGRTEPPGRGGEVTGRARPWSGEGAGVGIGPGEAWGRWRVRCLGRPPCRRRRRPGHVVQLHQHHGGGGGAAERQQDQDQEEAFCVPESEAIPGQRADPQRPDVGGEPHGNQPPAAPGLRPAGPAGDACTPSPSPLHAHPALARRPGRVRAPRAPREAWCLRGTPWPPPLPSSPSGFLRRVCSLRAAPGAPRGGLGARGHRPHPRSLSLHLARWVACVSPRLLRTRCPLPAWGTGQVALACPPVPLFLVAWLVWRLKVSRPPGHGDSFLGFLFSSWDTRFLEPQTLDQGVPGLGRREKVRPRFKDRSW